ncbi:hypothetical protein [Roseimaritima ulvae]|uniref:Transposase IS200-like domain-containing protein n=1 Tax=Roseimaritima ulvae TaxID=980254 RepID=A0A5B9QTF0_9BACT|nr:hypothetical protein [Roseimaritima ulvae]QEG42288.1 hypothetical protein UC8_43220 [Roseimaritima ulvae]
MARSARSETFDPDVVGIYHIYNKVVRSCFLFGVDRDSGKDYSYRRDVVVDRLRLLASQFAVDVMAYAVMSNHLHLVVRNRPDLVKTWDDREVVRRWLMICPEKRADDDSPVPPTEKQIQYLLGRPKEVAERRRRLSDPSWLMRMLCQYVGRKCNEEDNESGRFFGERYKSKRLLDEAAVLACMVYVDLNPLRAGMSDRLDGYDQASIADRLRQLDESLADLALWLAPLELSTEVDQQPVEVANEAAPAEAAPAEDESVEEESVGEKAVEEDSASADKPAPAVERLGCLPIGLERYVDLLKWLAVRSRPELEGMFQADAAGDTDAAEKLNTAGEQVLEGLGVDPTEFADCVDNFEHRFYTAVGCPASLAQEAKRRRRRWLKAPGRHALVRTKRRRQAA